MTSKNYRPASVIYLLPFFIFFTIIGVALLQPDYGSQTHQQSSIVNQLTLSLAYSIAFILLLKQQGLIPWIVNKAIPLDILFFLMLISLFWSDFPGKVVISVIHNIGAASVALCIAVLMIQNKDRFFKWLLISLFIYVMATIAVTLFRPDIGLMTSRNIYDIGLIGRWRGLTGHPNSLGAICLFTAWVALSAFFHTNNKKWVSFLAIITLVVDFYCLYKTNSMTSTLLSVALVFGMVWFAFIGNSIAGMKSLKIVLGFLVLFVGLMLLYILHPELFSEKYFFRAIGRDASLSGRTSLWKLGFKGFAAKPLLGWSYDGLVTFIKQYNLSSVQLHNGYLDLLVRGGLVSIFFFAVLLIQLSHSLIKQAFMNNKDYIVIFGLIVAVLMHNISEASILGNTSIIWLMFLIGYFYCLGIDRIKSSSTKAV
jgi:exopolysaccharide production protein ExoQ